MEARKAHHLKHSLATLQVLPPNPKVYSCSHILCHFELLLFFIFYQFSRTLPSKSDQISWQFSGVFKEAVMLNMSHSLFYLYPPPFEVLATLLVK
jgi:hypothetical protein